MQVFDRTQTAVSSHSSVIVDDVVEKLSTTVTVNVGEEEPAAEDAQEELRWEGPIAFMGKPTGDRRFLIPGKIEYRDLPLPLMAQFVTADGHDGAHIAGKIEGIWEQESLEEDGVIEIWATGTFDSGEMGMEAARLVDEETLTGTSVDISTTEKKLLHPETYEEIDTEEIDMLELLLDGGDYLVGIEGKIMGATLVPFQAFEDAKISAVTASGRLTVIRPRTLVAAAGPLKPPREWFEDPKLKELTPLQILPDGRVYGHLADWDGCYTGFQGICVPPFRSTTDYRYFNVGEIECGDGTLMPCGKLMFSRDGGKHAEMWMNAQEASKHYDDATKVGAFVRAGTDRFGTWLAGSLRCDLTDEDVQHLRTHPPSGDWRPIGGGPSELVAAFSVAIPGFPIPRAIAASADGSSYSFITAPLSYGPKRRRRRMTMLKERMAEALYRDGEITREQRRQLGVQFDDSGALAYTAEQRRKMARTGEALPDGSFPIANCGDAERAIHAQGRARDQRRAVAHIRKRVRALGCSGDIFDDYK